MTLPSNMLAEARHCTELFYDEPVSAVRRILEHKTAEAAYLALKVHGLLPTKAQSRFRRLLEAEVLSRS